MIGGGAKPGATKLAGVPMLENEDAAESVRGEAAPVIFGNPAGRPPMVFALGTKSNKGERRGATPYCRAMSRPRSRGILDFRKARLCSSVLLACQNGVPGSLVFSITTLDNLVFAWQDLLLQNLCTPAFVHTSNLQYLRSIYIGVCSPSHDRDAANHALVDLSVDAFQRGSW